jgi:hypothetical protein
VRGEQLHDFDVRLCRYALENVLGYTDTPAFAAYVQEQLDPPVWAYLQALAGEDDPPPLLLGDDELDDLAFIFETAPLEFDHAWVASERLHRRHIDCVVEVREGLAPAYAEEWARASAGFAMALERARTRLSDGIRVVHDWVREVRRLLRAMGAVDLLPWPEGGFPTLSCPDPRSLPAGSPGPCDGGGDADIEVMRRAIAEHERTHPTTPEDMRGRNAQPAALIRTAKIRAQRAKDALRELEKRGEYSGFARARPRRYLEGRPNEK